MDGDGEPKAPTRLKDMFGRDVPRAIGDMIARVHPAFDVRAFTRAALRGYDDLELTPRGRHIAAALQRHLPQDYPAAVDILVASLGPRGETEADLGGMAAFLYMPHVFFVAEYGVEHFEESMRAQYELTQRFTAEFSIRPFLVRHQEATLARLREWVDDPNVHVRRLVSEGTRPRLPWAMRLPAFQRDPRPVIALLDLLKDDPERYVRRSVANNVNDIAKDNPDAAVAVARRWMRRPSAERAWVVRHGLRTLAKQGRADALAVLGFGSGETLHVTSATITPASPSIGQWLTVSFTVVNTGEMAVRVLADLRVGFVKANGARSPKVFKVASLELGPTQTATVTKRISLAQHSTRTHYPGTHTVTALLNGTARELGTFELDG